MAHTSLSGGEKFSLELERQEEGRNHGLHWFAVAGLLEYLGGHVARSPARCSQDMERLFVHDSAETKVCDQ